MLLPVTFRNDLSVMALPSWRSRYKVLSQHQCWELRIERQITGSSSISRGLHCACHVESARVWFVKWMKAHLIQLLCFQLKGPYLLGAVYSTEGYDYSEEDSKCPCKVLGIVITKVRKHWGRNSMVPLGQLSGSLPYLKKEWIQGHCTHAEHINDLRGCLGSTEGRTCPLGMLKGYAKCSLWYSKKVGA